MYIYMIKIRNYFLHESCINYTRWFECRSKRTLREATLSHYSYRIADDADDARLQQSWPLRLETKDNLETQFNANETCISLAASQFVFSFRVKWFFSSYNSRIK